MSYQCLICFAACPKSFTADRPTWCRIHFSAGRRSSCMTSSSARIGKEVLITTVHARSRKRTIGNYSWIGDNVVL